MKTRVFSSTVNTLNGFPNMRFLMNDALLRACALSNIARKALGGFRVLPDYDIASVPKDYEALILIGGMTWRDGNAQQVKTLVEECCQKGKVLGGICDASAFLGTAGILNDVLHTSNDMNDLKQWAGSVYTGETKYIAKQAVRDKNIITANGTAPMEFAKELLLALNVASEEKVSEWYNFHKLGYYTASMPKM